MYKVQLQPLAMPGATRSSAPTISTPSMHPRPSCHQTGSLERTRCRENLISLLYYRHQLKGEDLKYGILLGVDAVLFYQFKDEASDIVWKRTKCCKNFFIRNLTCHTHTHRGNLDTVSASPGSTGRAGMHSLIMIRRILLDD